MRPRALSNIIRFLEEARRRKVYTSAVAYIAVAIGLSEIGDRLFVAFLPQQSSVAGKILTILLLLGFPIVLVFAWIFDIGPGGLQRTAALPEKPESAPLASGGWSGGFAMRPTETVHEIELLEEAPDPERVRHAALGFVRHELRTPINGIIGY